MTSHQTHHRDAFFDLILNSSDLSEMLKQLAKLHPQAYLSAGALRSTVWAFLHGQTFDLKDSEIDVIYYDGQERNNHVQQRLKQKLEQLFPQQQWDVVNQALVHTWYRKENGEQIQPISSIEHALSLWPETATAIALRLNSSGELELIAPFGLQDLFELRLRWNPALVSYTTFKNRVESKKWLQQWPRLQWVGPTETHEA
ncbi:nucleotidyltransferase family protein [Acinetobacter halotolerans]|uniref:Nucleotidyltransferase family protein n=1 Tax=Acinetobacter halotolerans TaxID=1752076 RepID=A0A4Q6XEV6_9GAMM|nr:nucleotidyltransferase family protein [Acinetobacter halotolerans]RZF49615.1 nucleotidyltransferase family protein [Acinetobacter halotolerans]